MQFHIRFSGSNIDLPLSYNHAVQSMLYHSLSSDTEYQDFLHNDGYAAQSHHFRLFTFGELYGRCKIANKRIIFDNEFSLQVRSVDEKFCQAIAQGFYVGRRFELAGCPITVTSIRMFDRHIVSDGFNIKMLSPVVVRVVRDDKSLYFPPEDNMFNEVINSNFAAKYEAFTGVVPDSPVRVYANGAIKKVVSRYKGIWINGYKGDMFIEGKPEYLDFLYNTGIGCKNAQGYGMFEPR